ncbi:MAG: putative thioredoxin [Bacteroidetes bacterium HLUCCA01]|nr:MAG: putative thioredoxin [Bacteroidetes bacterium HLUCCA01]
MKTVIKILAVITIIALFAVMFIDMRKGGSEVSGNPDYLTTIENASFVAIEDGETRINVSDFEGKLVLVDFWETWCVPCLNSMPTFQQILDEYPDQFVVLAVSPGWSDEMEDVREFKSNHEYSFIYVYDDNEVSTALEISGIPYKVFIGPDGKYISTEMGTGGHERDYNKIVAMLQEHLGVASR